MSGDSTLKDLLELLAQAAEFSGIAIRQGEKTVSGSSVSD